MTTQLDVLFSLEISHTYYGGRCRDFGYVLPHDTMRLLRNGRMMPRTFAGKLYILYERNESGGAIVPLDGVTLRVGLVLLNPYFCNFTNLPYDPGAVAAQFANQPDPRQLTEQPAVALVGPVLSHALSSSSRPVLATVMDAGGATLGAETRPAGDARSTVSWDLTGAGPGPVVVRESYTGTTATTDYYLDAELARAAAFAVAQVRIDGGFYAAAPALRIQFTAKQDTLKYYLVAANYTNAEVAQFGVKDAGFTDEGRPEIQFAKVLPAAFTSAELDPVLLGAGQVMLFASHASVSRLATGRKKIQLQRNNQVVIEHLPQPRPESATSDVIVHVAKT